MTKCRHHWSQKSPTAKIKCKQSCNKKKIKLDSKSKLFKNSKKSWPRNRERKSKNWTKFPCRCRLTEGGSKKNRLRGFKLKVEKRIWLTRQKKWKSRLNLSDLRLISLSRKYMVWSKLFSKLNKKEIYKYLKIWTLRKIICALKTILRERPVKLFKCNLLPINR